MEGPRAGVRASIDFRQMGARAMPIRKSVSAVSSAPAGGAGSSAAFSQSGVGAARPSVVSLRADPVQTLESLLHAIAAAASAPGSAKPDNPQSVDEPAAAATSGARRLTALPGPPLAPPPSLPKRISVLPPPPPLAPPPAAPLHLQSPPSIADFRRHVRASMSAGLASTVAPAPPPRVVYSPAAALASEVGSEAVESWAVELSDDRWDVAADDDEDAGAAGAAPDEGQAVRPAFHEAQASASLVALSVSVEGQGVAQAAQQGNSRILAEPTTATEASSSAAGAGTADPAPALPAANDCEPVRAGTDAPAPPPASTDFASTGADDTTTAASTAVDDDDYSGGGDGNGCSDIDNLANAAPAESFQGWE